jgi:hypothetical protein
VADQRAAIVGGNRIPFARANGPYARASNQDMDRAGRSPSWIWLPAGLTSSDESQFPTNKRGQYPTVTVALVLDERWAESMTTTVTVYVPGVA